MSIISIDGNKVLTKLYNKTVKIQEEKYKLKYFYTGICGINIYILFIDTMFSIMIMFENIYEKYDKVVINFNENGEFPKEKHFWSKEKNKRITSEEFLFQAAFALKGLIKFLIPSARKEFEDIDKYLEKHVKKYKSSLKIDKYVGSYPFERDKYLRKFIKNIISYQGFLNQKEIKFLFLKTLSYIKSNKFIFNFKFEKSVKNTSIFDFILENRCIIFDTNPDYSYDIFVENKDFKRLYLDNDDELLFDHNIYDEITSEFNIISKEDIIDYTNEIFNKFNKQSKMFKII